MVGISLAVVGLLVGLVQAGLTRIVNPRLGNDKSIYLGLFLYAVGLILFAFATETWMMFAFLVPYCLGGICGPALQSVIAGHVPPNEQGELQGALTSLMSLTTIIGPPIMNNIFFQSTKKGGAIHFPGAFFLLAGIIMLVSLVITFNVLRREKKEHPELRHIIEGPAEGSVPGGH